MNRFGVSLSIKQCRNFGIQPMDCLRWLLNECGFRRFRLMSYWDELEKTPGEYDFQSLDKQVALIDKHQGTISLCIGARQPRWPENHWPDWAWKLSPAKREAALLKFLEAVISHYQDQPSIVSYQLENEALLEDFGLRPEVDRRRLRREFRLVKQLDSTRPIIMTTSTSWGIPLRRPIPDIVGFSYYQIHFNAKKQAYSRSFHRPWLHRLRAGLIRLIWHRPSVIHELQLEPWGPKNIWEMDAVEQNRSMSTDQIVHNLQAAQKTRLWPIDLWGGEWWYWCSHQRHDSSIADTILDHLTASLPGDGD